MKVDCVVVAMQADGSPGFFKVRVNCTEEQYNNGDHYDIARERALEKRYEKPMLVFDEYDGPDWLFKNV